MANEKLEVEFKSKLSNYTNCVCKMANKFYRFLTCLPGSLYRTVKYAKTIPFWRWF